MIFAEVHQPDRHSRTNLIRCEAETIGQTAYWRRRMNRSIICGMTALYSIDLKPYCKLHAGAELLRRSLNHYRGQSHE